MKIKTEGEAIKMLKDLIDTAAGAEQKEASLELAVGLLNDLAPGSINLAGTTDQRLQQISGFLGQYLKDNASGAIR